MHARADVGLSAAERAALAEFARLYNRGFTVAEVRRLRFARRPAADAPSEPAPGWRPAGRRLLAGFADALARLYAWGRASRLIGETGLRRAQGNNRRRPPRSAGI